MFALLKRLFRERQAGREATRNAFREFAAEEVDLRVGIEFERRKTEHARDLAEVGSQNLELLSSIEKTARDYNDGSDLMAEATRLYREGVAKVLLEPIIPGEDPERKMERLH